MAQQGFFPGKAGFGSQAAFGSPLLGPDIAQKQYQMAQRQAYAQALMQQGMEPLQGQNVGGHYVAPSWTQGLAKALGSYLGMKAMADMPQQQQELQQMQNQQLAAQFGLGQPQPAQGPQSMPVGEQTSQPTIPLLPGRSAQDSFVIAQGMGLPAYLKMVGEQGNQKPIAVAPGGTLVDPRTNMPTFTAAQNGIQITYGPNGAQAVAVPGYGPANASIQGAEAGAKAGATMPFDIAKDRDRQKTSADLELIDVPDGSGGSIKMPRSQYIQMISGGAQAPTAAPVPPPASNQVPPPAAGQPGGIGSTPPKAVLEAREQYGSMEAAANQLLTNIDALRKSEGFGKNYGIQGLFPNMAGSKASDALALTNQVISQGWLEMRDRLKGTGTITDYESQKAEKAWSTLNDPRISEKLAREQLDILEQTIKMGLGRIQKKAQITPQEKPQDGFSNGDFSSLWGG